MNRIDSETYGNFRDAVVRQISRDMCVVLAQFEFQNRLQESSESINEYITALRSLAEDCSFVEKHDEWIALQLVAGCRSKAGWMNCLMNRMDEIINTL